MSDEIDKSDALKHTLGGPDWRIASYWGGLGICVGVDRTARALLAALMPPLAALIIFVRQAF